MLPTSLGQSLSKANFKTRSKVLVSDNKTKRHRFEPQAEETALGLRQFMFKDGIFMNECDVFEDEENVFKNGNDVFKIKDGVFKNEDDVFEIK